MQSQLIQHNNTPSSHQGEGRKITFINPPYERVAAGYEFIRHIANLSPSLGLLHLAAEVRQHGYTPKIIESDIFNLTVDDIVERIIEDKPEYIGITLFTVGVWCAAEIALKVKEALPDTIIFVGGPHISSMGYETMVRFEQFDYAVVGEGEKTLMDLLEAIETGSKLSNVPEIIFRKDDKPFKTLGKPINRNLDELPYPAWDLLEDFPNAYRPAVFDFPRGPVATIAASRGCPFHCQFCDTSTFGDRVRSYSPEAVFSMMLHLKETYGIRHIMFVDDLFLASRKRTEALCQLILENNLQMTWSCAARVDTVKPDLLSVMKKSGCWEISFGLETGSNELLKKMDKSADVEESEQAIHWTHDAGIRTKGLFMLGFPGEDEATMQATKDFVRRIPMTIMHLTKFTPYPGSPIYRKLYGTNILDEHWEKMNGMNFVWAPEGMSIKDLDRHYQEILTWFYKRPKVTHYYIRMIFRNPNHLLRLLRFARGFLAAKTRSFLKGQHGLLVNDNL